MAEQLIGSWRSTDAMGNTKLDWWVVLSSKLTRLAKLTRLLCCRTEAVKEEKAKILIQFTETQLTMTLTSKETPERDITQEMEHLPPMPANFTVEDTELKVEGDKSDLKWTFEKEDEDTLMIRY